MHKILLSSFLASLLVHSSLSDDRSVKVPGVQVGWSIGFFYYGQNIKRVTLSIDDSIGKSLHLELRHNDKCTDDGSPEILFNTKTNGQFDTAVTIERTELTITEWIVEAKKDHWLIKKKKCQYCFSDNDHEAFIFDYRSPHALSDVKKIRIYGTSCNGGEIWEALSSMQQVVPASFSQIHIRGLRNKLWSQMHFYFQSGNYMGYSLGKTYITVFSPNWGSRKLAKPITTETFDEVILQNIGGGKYKMTIIVGDEETLEYVGDLRSYNIDQNWVVGTYMYSEITKFEIKY